MKYFIRLLGFLFILTLFIFVMSGCAWQNEITISPTKTQAQLIPYHSELSSKTPERDTSTRKETPSNTPIPSPTPTPYTYKVVQGDTFTSIAYRHGVKVSDLIALNPNIDPNFLTIGISITIPITKSTSSFELNPTPIPLEATSPACYRNSLDGLWCLVIMKNTQPYDVENISANFLVTTAITNPTKSQMVFSPLYVLPSGSSIPLMAYFPPPNPEDLEIDVEILSVIPKSSEISRYLTPILANDKVQISTNHLTAVVSGEVSILENSQAEQIWVVAVAYDPNGYPVGTRKWESSNPLNAGDTLLFEFGVHSLGPPIHRVDIFVEAHP